MRNQNEKTVYFLYRYRPFRDEWSNLRKILIENQWWFGSRTEFDDVEDSVLPGVLLPSPKYTREKYGPLGEGAEHELKRWEADPTTNERRLTASIQRNIDNVGMLCLSELPDHPKLWREYADDGMGVCLELAALEIAVSGYESCLPQAVRYSDEPKRFWDPRGDQTFQLAQTTDILLRKRSSWSYQKEWRLILARARSDQKTVGFQSIRPSALRRVLLGWRLTDRDCDTIHGWIDAGPFRTPTVRFALPPPRRGERRANARR